MSEPSDERVYAYQPKPRWMRLIPLILVALVLLYAQPFPPFGLFVGVGGLIGSLMGLSSVAWHRMRCPKTLVLTNDAVVIPKSSWSSELVVVPYATIISLERDIDPRAAIMGMIANLNIVYPSGRVTIIGMWLPAQKDLEEIEQFIRSKLKP